jgi:hypothetical protein
MKRAAGCSQRSDYLPQIVDPRAIDARSSQVRRAIENVGLQRENRSQQYPKSKLADFRVFMMAPFGVRSTLSPSPLAVNGGIIRRCSSCAQPGERAIESAVATFDKF